MRTTLRLAIVLGLSTSLLLAAAAPSGAEPAASKAAPKAAAPAGAANKPGAQSAEQQLRARVKGYWDARVARSEKIFDYYLPEEKGGIPKNHIFEGGALGWRSYKIVGVEIKGDQAAVTVDVKATLLIAKAMPIPEESLAPRLTENWRRTDGVWYREASQPGTSQGAKAPAAPAAEAPATVAPEAGAKGAADTGAAEGVKK